MPATGTQKQPDPPPRVERAPSPAKPHIYTLEATGVIFTAVLILILTLIRYWRHIPWSAR